MTFKIRIALSVPLVIVAVTKVQAGGTVVGWAGSVVPQGLTNVVAVAAGAWGHYALSQGDFTPSIPVVVPESVTNIVAIAGGMTHSVALNTRGMVLAWGTNTTDGQTYVPSNLSGVVAIAAGDNHSLALKSDGTVVAWGANNAGQSNVPFGLSNVVAIAGGISASLALRADGFVTVWGDTGLYPVRTDLTNVVAIAGGDDFLALKGDGTVVGWGSARYSVPPGLTDVSAVSAGLGNFDAQSDLALKSDGTVVGWGFEFAGPLVPPGLSNVVEIAAGGIVGSLALVGGGPSTTFAPPVVVGTLTSDGFGISVPTQNGRVYRLQFKNSLIDPTWSSLPLVAGNGSVRILKAPNEPTTQRYYRVQRW